MTFQEIEAKFDGVFDFTNAVDCQSVIRILLRDNEFKDKALSFTTNRLADFAEQVLAVGIDPSLKEQALEYASQRVQIKNRTARETINFILKMVENGKLAEKMTDSQLLSATFDAWSDEDISSQKSAVIEELITRFKKAKKRKRKAQGSVRRRIL